MKKIFIYSNNDSVSLEVKKKLDNLFTSLNIGMTANFSNDVDFVISIGGDGTFLSTVKEINYTDIPILGINTGHLGFYAEYTPNELDEVVLTCKENNYKIQNYKTIKVDAELEDKKITLDPALNDVFVKHGSSSIVHLDLYIGKELIENFSGDGILVSSSAGSTAYNYSLGGSIVDPRNNLLQITPVAPANNAAYRSITSSLVVPANETINIVPKDEDNTILVVDGNENRLTRIKKISIALQDKEIKIVRRNNYSFWSKVRSKFL